MESIVPRIKHKDLRPSVINKYIQERNLDTLKSIHYFSTIKEFTITHPLSSNAKISNPNSLNLNFGDKVFIQWREYNKINFLASEGILINRLSDGDRVEQLILSESSKCKDDSRVLFEISLSQNDKKPSFSNNNLTQGCGFTLKHLDSNKFIALKQIESTYLNKFSETYTMILVSSLEEAGVFSLQSSRKDKEKYLIMSETPYMLKENILGISISLKVPVDSYWPGKVVKQKENRFMFYFIKSETGSTINNNTDTNSLRSGSIIYFRTLSNNVFLVCNSKKKIIEKSKILSLEQDSSNAKEIKITFNEIQRSESSLGYSQSKDNLLSQLWEVSFGSFQEPLLMNNSSAVLIKNVLTEQILSLSNEGLVIIKDPKNNNDENLHLSNLHQIFQKTQIDISKSVTPYLKQESRLLIAKNHSFRIQRPSLLTETTIRSLLDLNEGLKRYYRFFSTWILEKPLGIKRGVGPDNQSNFVVAFIDLNKRKVGFHIQLEGIKNYFETVIRLLDVRSNKVNDIRQLSLLLFEDLDFNVLLGDLVLCCFAYEVDLVLKCNKVDWSETSIFQKIEILSDLKSLKLKCNLRSQMLAELYEQLRTALVHFLNNLLMNENTFRIVNEDTLVCLIYFCILEKFESFFMFKRILETTLNSKEFCKYSPLLIDSFFYNYNLLSISVSRNSTRINSLIIKSLPALYNSDEQFKSMFQNLILKCQNCSNENDLLKLNSDKIDLQKSYPPYNLFINYLDSILFNTVSFRITEALEIKKSIRMDLSKKRHFNKVFSVKSEEKKSINVELVNDIYLKILKESSEVANVNHKRETQKTKIGLCRITCNSHMDVLCSILFHLKNKTVKNISKISNSENQSIDIGIIISVLDSKELIRVESLTSLFISKIILSSLKTTIAQTKFTSVSVLKNKDQRIELENLQQALRIYIYEYIPSIFSIFIHQTPSSVLKFRISYQGVKYILLMIKRVEVKMTDLRIIEKCLVKLLYFCVAFVKLRSGIVKIKENKKLLKLVLKIIFVILKIFKSIIDIEERILLQPNNTSNFHESFLLKQFNEDLSATSEELKKDIRLSKFSERLSSLLGTKQSSLISIEDSDELSKDSRITLTLLLKDFVGVEDVFGKLTELVKSMENEISQIENKTNFKDIEFILWKINSKMFHFIFSTISYKEPIYNFSEIKLEKYNNWSDSSDCLSASLNLFCKKHIIGFRKGPGINNLLDIFVKFLKNKCSIDLFNQRNFICGLKTIFCNFVNFVLEKNEEPKNAELVQKLIDTISVYFLTNQLFVSLTSQFTNQLLAFHIENKFDLSQLFKSYLNNLKDSFHMYMMINYLSELYLQCSDYKTDYLKKQKKVIHVFNLIIREVDSSLTSYAAVLVNKLVIKVHFIKRLEGIDHNVICNNSFYYLLSLYILCCNSTLRTGPRTPRSNSYLEQAIFLIKKSNITIKYRIKLAECVFETIIKPIQDNMEVYTSYLREVFDPLLTEINQHFFSEIATKKNRYESKRVMGEISGLKKSVLFKIKHREVTGFMVLVLNVMEPLIQQITSNSAQLKFNGFNLNNFKKDIGTFMNINFTQNDFAESRNLGVVELLTFLLLHNELSRQWNVINLYTNRLSCVFDSRKGSFGSKDVNSINTVSETHEFYDSCFLSKASTIICASGLSLNYYLENLVSEQSSEFVSVLKETMSLKESVEFTNLISVKNIDNNAYEETVENIIRVIFSELYVLLPNFDQKSELVDFYSNNLRKPKFVKLSDEFCRLQESTHNLKNDKINHLKTLLLTTCWQNNRFSDYLYKSSETNPQTLKLLLHILNKDVSLDKKQYIPIKELCHLVIKSNSLEIINMTIVNIKQRIKLNEENNYKLLDDSIEYQCIIQILSKVGLILKYLMNNFEDVNPKDLQAYLKSVNNIFYILSIHSDTTLNHLPLITSGDCFKLLEAIVLNNNKEVLKLDKMKAKLTDFIFGFFKNFVSSDSSEDILIEMTSLVFSLITKILNFISTNNISNKTQVVMLFNLSKVLKKLLHDQHLFKNIKIDIESNTGRLDLIFVQINSIYKNLSKKQIDYFHSDHICSLNSKLINNQTCECTFKECLEKKCSILVYCIIKSCYEYFYILKKSENKTSELYLDFCKDFKEREIFVEIKHEESLILFSFQKNSLYEYATNKMISKFNSEVLEAKDSRDYELIFNKMETCMEKLIIQKHINHFLIISLYNKIRDTLDMFVWLLYVFYVIYIYVSSEVWDASSLVKCLFCTLSTEISVIIKLIYLITSTIVLIVNGSIFVCRVLISFLKKRKRQEDEKAVSKERVFGSFDIFRNILCILSNKRQLLVEFILTLLIIPYPIIVFVLILIKSLSLPKVKLYIVTILSDTKNILLILSVSLVFIFFLFSITNLTLVITSSMDYSYFFSKLKSIMFTNTIYLGQENYDNLNSDTFQYLDIILMPVVIIFKWLFCPLVFAFFFKSTFVYLETINGIKTTSKKHCSICKQSELDVTMSKEIFKQHITVKHCVRNYFFLLLHLYYPGQSQISKKNRKLISMCEKGDFSFMILK